MCHSTLYFYGRYGEICFLLKHLFVCTVTDFSGGALAIGVKFCMAVRPDLGQVFVSFWGNSPRDGRVLGVNRGHMAGYASCWSTCYLLEPLLPHYYTSTHKGRQDNITYYDQRTKCDRINRCFVWQNFKRVFLKTRKHRFFHWRLQLQLQFIKLAQLQLQLHFPCVITNVQAIDVKFSHDLTHQNH